MEKMSIKNRINELFQGFNIELDKRHSLVDKIHSLFYRLEKERCTQKKKERKHYAETADID